MKKLNKVKTVRQEEIKERRTSEENIKENIVREKNK